MTEDVTFNPAAPIQTVRFNLVSCNTIQSYKVSESWRSNPTILHNMMVTRENLSRWYWVRYSKTDQKKSFVHAVIDREARTTIGAHRLHVDKSGTASLGLVIHADRWHGKGAFEEVRSGILDHFCNYDRVVRFSGLVVQSNHASIYNYKKLGFRWVGYEQKSFFNPKTDNYENTHMFEMMVEDWKEKRSQVTGHE